MKKFFGIIVLTVLMFYHIYPAAIGMFGFSFIFTSGGLGIALYIYNRTPFPEIAKVFMSYLFLTFFCFFTAYMNSYYDPYWIDTTKSQVAWFFSAYLVVYSFNAVHKGGSIHKLFYYFIAAVCIQGAISLLMYWIPPVASFFNSIQLLDIEAEIKRDDTEGARLLGYGTAFFGAGIIYGIALILVVYIIMTKTMNLRQRIFCAVVYAYIFFVGLLTARTVMVGAGGSLVLLIILFLLNRNKGVSAGQALSFIGISVVLVGIGQTLVYLYFPEFAEWAFEAFLNYQETGSFSTRSSDSLEYMFILPKTMAIWLYGNGHMLFWGSDVGYTRLLIYFGVPGTFAFFFYQFMIMKLSFTRNKALNLTLITLFAYNMALNVKGLSDLNSTTYLILLYILNYKYFVYLPQTYQQGKYNKYGYTLPPLNNREN
ncbi:hypothetical protein M2132_000236 [Dysgonomonas sp. PH5-45]|uniref:hypothetical protein n=1 Tax=unclassified Dysgonomonas TaxID=2630389 RepID=UPI0024757B14|nr:MULTISPECIES: hypothetical protein [unclassified Dysgonomonas]MDH6353916.1 hypothetical protein [Dysgonomonas sp. PH5-45]MDH6386818.1 hypothetical protein [Dysgonomonas sp. PH5-37]